MKYKNYRLTTLLGVVGACLTGSPVQAANTFYDPGNLMLFFRSATDTDTLYVDLNEAYVYRGTASGPNGAPSPQFVLNISTELVAAFGANWATDGNLFAGLAGVRSSTAGTTVTNGDPKRTVYLSQSRNSLAGNIFAQNSTGLTIASDTSISTVAGRITTMSTAFENGPDTQATVLIDTASGIDEQNPLINNAGDFIQGTAFGDISGGVMQEAVASNNLGTIDNSLTGNLGTIEFALDLYRVLSATGVNGQIDGPLRTGTFEGSVLVGTNGNITFIPEPSSVALLGLSAGALLIRRRRN